MKLHLVNFLGCGTNSIRQKYTSVHRKMVPTSNLNMTEEISLAKKVKYMIFDQAQLRGGNYDMMLDSFDGEEKDDMTPSPLVNITDGVEEVSTSNSSKWIVELKVNISKKATNPDILTIMVM